MNWKEYLYQNSGKHTLKEIIELFPNTNYFTVRKFCLTNGIDYKPEVRQDTPVQKFIRENGHKYTIDELCNLFPNATKSSIKSFCHHNDIFYKKIKETNTNRKTYKNTNPEYFNVTEHETWLI